MATHVVPPLQTPPVLIGSPAASATLVAGSAVSAPKICADISEYVGCGLSLPAQSGSVILFDWYQTTFTRPASPATAHGQSTRAFAGAAIVWSVQVMPWSFETASWILFGSGVGAPLQPPIPFGARSSVSQVR